MNLSKDQKKAINHFNGPALILAVPGAGKTTVIINRTAKLVENHGVDPRRILSITFSKASANDMKNRFTEDFQHLSSMPIEFSTIHSFCFKLIRDYAYKNNITYRLIEGNKNEINKYNLIKKIYLDTNNSYITEEKLESLLNSIGYIKNMMISVDEFLKDNKTDIDNFKTIFNLYENYKKENNLIDFDDMLTSSYHILINNKAILNKYRAAYDFIQLDEGQDTSKIQLELIKLIASPNNNLFIVADDDQSIYGFRGAYPQALFEFSKTYKDAKLFFMEENYRSTKNIVSVSNNFIKTNTLRYIKNISTSNDFLQPINIIKVNSIEEEYQHILQDLKDKDLGNSSILYRNNLSAIGLIDFFDKNNIPFNMKDTNLKFFNHWVLEDIINFILFSQDTSNMAVYEKIYYKKKGYISKKQLNYAKKLNYNMSVFQRISDFPSISNFYKKNLYELKRDFKKLSKLRPFDAISFIEYDLKYEKYLKENSIKFGFTYDNLKTILYYLKLISKECENLDDLLNRLDYLKHLCTNSKDNKDSITLSTVHSAKGLEFSNVYMIDLVDGDFPSISSIEAFEKKDFKSLEEERRLFYVGMTRAKHYLTLITTNNMGGRRTYPSRFLLELEKFKN